MALLWKREVTMVDTCRWDRHYMYLGMTIFYILVCVYRIDVISQREVKKVEPTKPTTKNYMSWYLWKNEHEKTHPSKWEFLRTTFGSRAEIGRRDGQSCCCHSNQEPSKMSKFARRWMPVQRIDSHRPWQQQLGTSCERFGTWWMMMMACHRHHDWALTSSTWCAEAMSEESTACQTMTLCFWYKLYHRTLGWAICTKWKIRLDSYLHAIGTSNDTCRFEFRICW